MFSGQAENGDMSSSSTGPGAQALVCLVIGILELIAIGAAGPFVMLLIALALVWYGYLSQAYANGSSSPDVHPYDEDIVTIKRFAPPRSLFVVPMHKTESELIDVVIWMPAIQAFTPRMSPEQIVGCLA